MVNYIRLHVHVTVLIVTNLKFLYRCSNVITILFIMVISIRFISFDLQKKEKGFMVLIISNTFAKNQTVISQS